MLTAAARTARTLVWPADVPDTGDLADAFRARLDALAKRAHIHGMPRYAAAAGDRRAGGGADDETGTSSSACVPTV